MLAPLVLLAQLVPLLLGLLELLIPLVALMVLMLMVLPVLLSLAVLPIPPVPLMRLTLLVLPERLVLLVLPVMLGLLELLVSVTLGPWKLRQPPLLLVLLVLPLQLPNTRMNLTHLRRTLPATLPARDLRLPTAGLRAMCIVYKWTSRLPLRTKWNCVRANWCDCSTLTMTAG